MKIKAFTLIEFIITMAVAAIFIMVAVPGFYNVMQNNKITSMTNQLAASINYARLEAIKRGYRVSVCSAADASLSTCGTAAQWSQGWMVFNDPDNDNIIDAVTDLVKVSEAVPSNMVITANSNIISFDGSGFLLSVPITISLSALDCTGLNARVLSVTSSGRLTVARTQCP